MTVISDIEKRPATDETNEQSPRNVKLARTLLPAVQDPAFGTFPIGASTETIAAAIAACKTGVLSISGMEAFPMADARVLMDCLAGASALQEKLNSAYQATGAAKLVWKDSFASGKGGDSVDQKKVLDLAPHRLEAISKACPEALDALGAEFHQLLGFYQRIEESIVPKLLQALSTAVGAQMTKLADYSSAYRTLDYYEREADAKAPRCGEHRDYGILTLIFQDDVGGLEVKINGSWTPVPPGEAVLLFGWCTQIRSNGRLPAAMHRVSDPRSGKGKTIPRRTAGVLFVAPNPSASIAPVVGPGEVAKYRYTRADELKGIMARKWEMREGTIAAEKVPAELKEQEAFKTQDDIVQRHIGIN
eukprot:g229.t1